MIDDLIIALCWMYSPIYAKIHEWIDYFKYSLTMSKQDREDIKMAKQQMKNCNE